MSILSNRVQRAHDVGDHHLAALKKAAIAVCNAAVMLHRAAALSLRAIARRPLLETASSCFRIVVRSQFRCSFKSQQDDTSKKKKPHFVLPYSHLSIRTVPPATPISLDFQSPLRSQSCSGDQLRMFHDMRSPTDTAPSATTGAAATLDKAAQHVRCPLGIIRCLWLKSCTAQHCLLRRDCKICCSQAEELVCHGQRNPPSLEDSWLGV